jgi:AcrR family transcriptional regulator
MPTPNQEARREALVDAAVMVLASQGVGACSARTIAEASPLTKSALHYYFGDVGEIVDLAFRRLMGDFVDRVEKAAADQTDPVAALWAAVETYLRLGADRPGRVPMLWFEYHVDSIRRGDTATITALTDRTQTLLGRLVAATGVADPAARAEVLFSALIGTVVRDTMHHSEVPAVLDDLAVALGMPRG